ncbi:MAG: adenosylcobalamin-dependent ribonucleoside-diphosphate reductase [Planctomycetes bacterium]|nr:adenosylcobalamin-dependent ribonucleoside-diphosphate reductase [Planctomycetota bacterium]
MTMRSAVLEKTPSSDTSRRERVPAMDRQRLGKIPLTENQRKVITDKYLRDTASVEEWLYGVARNIALAELLYDPAIARDEIFKNVRCVRHLADLGGGETTEVMHLHEGFKSTDEQDKNHRQFITNLYRLAEENARGRAVVEEWTWKYYALLSRFDFLPNSPTLMNAGRELQQLSACYVLPIEDSIDAWGDLVKHTMLIHKSGGGTGFSGCRVRPKGDAVKSTKGVASGAISPFLIINHTTEEIKQGGTRRGANMGILPYWHPDVLEFIGAKTTEGRLDNFNISVGVDAKFMQLVAEDGEYDLINPRTRETAKRVRARAVFEQIAENAWRSGDPGVIFLDRINNSLSNPTPQLGQIEATNPCGEQPLLPYEPCNLGSLNLSRFVKNGEVDWKALGDVTATTIRFLDDVIDVNNYPLPEIEKIAKGNRRIGLGVMGWAEMLALLEVPYDSEAAILKAEEVMHFINERAMEASEELARTRGPFPNWKDSIYDEKSIHHKAWAKGRPRHCARTTIAPTGTIAIASGLQGGGIEPFFAISYTRYNAKALDAIKRGETPAEKDTFHEINPLFKKVAEQHDFFGLTPESLWKKIEHNHTSARGIKEIPEEIQRIFATAHDVEVEFHVRQQAAFQKHTDNGVSKTINLPNSATVADIKRIYQLSWDLGCKGITVYRDGCKTTQVLNLKPTSKTRDLTEGLTSVYYKFETGYGPVHIHVVHDEGDAVRIFTNTTPIGTEIAGLTSVLGIMISKYLELGGDVAEVRKHLNAVKSDRPYGFGPQRVESIPHAVSIALTRFLKQQGKLPQTAAESGALNGVSTGGVAAAAADEERDNRARSLHCPKCYSPNIAYRNGCHGPTCYECGYSECS